MSPTLKSILDELEESFDKQIDPEQVREDYDAPDDREYSVNITAKQWRAFSSGMNEHIIPEAIERAQRDERHVAAIEHLRRALELADADQPASYRIGAMEQYIKHALVALDAQLRVVLYDNGKHHEVDHARYGLQDGEGVLVLVKGAQILLPPIVST